MTTFRHDLVECEKCGIHYCLGCHGDSCPHCAWEQYMYAVIEDEIKLEALFEKYDKSYDYDSMDETDALEHFQKYFEEMRILLGARQ